MLIPLWIKVAEPTPVPYNISITLVTRIHNRNTYNLAGFFAYLERFASFFFVIPAQAGIHPTVSPSLGPRLHGDDE